MYKKIIVLMSVIFLFACTPKPKIVPVDPVIKEAVFIPMNPSPVSIYVPNFYVVTAATATKLLADNKNVLIAMSYNDSIELRKSLLEINAYILKLNLNNETLIKEIKQ